MSLFFHRRSNGIVNVKMVITEEKILSNIDKIQKLINPNSKKQIVKLEEDSYFKDLVESVKSYLLEYPKKNNFPTNVYNAAYGLVEYATNQFEENTKTVEDLIRKREKNIKLGSVLRDATKVVKARAKNWKQIVDKLEPKYSKDVADALRVIGGAEDTESEEYQKAVKAIDVKINNLESNIHIEIDMGRIEDRSKALSYIGIEIAEALKYIPAPVEGQSEGQEEATVGTSKGTKGAKGKKGVQAEQTNVGEDLQGTIGNIIDSIDEEIEEAVEEAEDYDADVEETEEVENEGEGDFEEGTGDIDEDVEGGEDAGEDDEDYDYEEDEEDYEYEESEEDYEDVEEDGYDEGEYEEETRFEKKPSLWQRIKNSKFVRTVNYILKIRVVLDYPALPDADSNK